MKQLITMLALFLTIVGFAQEMNISYGEHPQQMYDIYFPDEVNENTKVVVFIHGGGWTAEHRQRDYWGYRNYVEKFFSDAITDLGMQTLPYTFTHTIGERYEVSANNSPYVFDNNIRYVEYWQEGRDYPSGVHNKQNVIAELQALYESNNMALGVIPTLLGGATQSVSYPLANATDGDLGSFLTFNTPTQQGGIKLDLGTIQNIDIVQFYVSTGLSYDIFNVEIFVAKDNGYKVSIFKTAQMHNNNGNFNSYNVKL